MSQTAETIKQVNNLVDVANVYQKKIGVCLLATNVDTPTGGIQSISFRLLEELERRGHKTFICTRNYENKPLNENRNGTLIHRSPLFRRSFTVLNSVSYIIDGLAWLIKHRREYDIIHCQQMFAPAMLGLLAKSILGKPVLIAVHRTGETGEVQGIHKIRFSRLRLRQLQAADCWVALSQEMKEELQSLKIPPEKIQFIPNGVSLPTEVNFAVGVKELYRAKLNLPYKQIVVFTGRLSAEKGLDTLVRAWVKVHRQHPEAHLLILGEGIGKQVNFKAEFGNIENELRSLLASLNLDNVVHLLGFKPNPTDYLLAANLFVLPSRSEAMSVSLIEAMASGTAVIASDIRGNHALCENEVNSLLFPLEDETALAQVIVRVLSNSEVEEKLGRAARKKAESDLTVEVMTDRYLNLYSSLK